MMSNEIKLGYLMEGDLVSINNEVVEPLTHFNVYAEAKKFMWEKPELDYDSFVTVLKDQQLIKAGSGIPTNGFIINHTSSNIFATEALFKDYDKLLSLISSEMVGYIATWMNTDTYFKDLKKLFVSFEQDEIKVEELLTTLAGYEKEFKELV